MFGLIVSLFLKNGVMKPAQNARKQLKSTVSVQTVNMLSKIQT